MSLLICQLRKFLAVGHGEILKDPALLIKTARRAKVCGGFEIPNLEDVKNHWPFQALPGVGDKILINEAYLAAVSFLTKQPRYVCEKVTRLTCNKAQNLNGLIGHSEGFDSDEEIPEPFRISDEGNYFGALHWSKGHMAPSGHHRNTSSSNRSTFKLNTNIVPQDMSQNGCDWYKLERYVPDYLLKIFSEVYVVSGPIFRVNEFEPAPPVHFTKTVHIGDLEIPVPSDLFKIIIVKNPEGGWAYSAFAMPNSPILVERPLCDYLVDLETIEKRTGLQFDELKSKAIMTPLFGNEGKFLGRQYEKPYALLDNQELNVLSWRLMGRLISTRDKTEIVEILFEYNQKPFINDHVGLMAMWKHLLSIDPMGPNWYVEFAKQKGKDFSCAIRTKFNKALAFLKVKGSENLSEFVENLREYFSYNFVGDVDEISKFNDRLRNKWNIRSETERKEALGEDLLPKWREKFRPVWERMTRMTKR